MQKLQLHVFLICLLAAGISSAQTKSKRIAKGATVQQAGKDFAFTEGPAVAADGRVYFTDQPNDRIHVWDENKGISLWLEGTGRSNGMYFNAKQQLVTCADEKNQLAYFDENKRLQVIQEGYNGKHLNAPNDLWIAPNGGIYFSDPYYHRKWWPEGHTEIQDTRGVYYVAPHGSVIRVIDDFETPNGLIGTPDGKTLYVADIQAGKTWKYAIQSDGTLANKTFFAPNGSDGMTIDNKGNIYLTSGKVWVYSPQGELLEEIEFSEKPANVCFGGKNRKTLFVTARKGVYTLQMKVKGVD
ncbi:SMP-30/gluconolactonase/LRE family protein [Prolixibacteraceae bacterium Z1-6]|uniref:SMP-30/gluconolactonase/LRE family protein n=1 Tax=Draconibacterium aestuarii TaxID=2998507 RepID=A0A9X3F9L4_9BACT|nr:SMP-30/gluconolactonase/LRE family protein [Prolixibacteraceae bacterium Z1-6]